MDFKKFQLNFKCILEVFRKILEIFQRIFCGNVTKNKKNFLSFFGFISWTF